MFYKRKRFLLIIAVILIAIFIFGCKNPSSDDNSIGEGTFSIHFIDVGQGDCTFMRFSDGKTMLVDCGKKDEAILNKIVNFIKKADIDTIDYFVLTHPDGDHTGNAVDIISQFNIGTVFMPDIYEGHLKLYPAFESAVKVIKEKNITVNPSDYYDYIVGDDYGIAFLSPAPKFIADSAYNDFNSSVAPTDTQSNATSAVVYIEAQGVRCLLTGDLTSYQEKKLLTNLSVLNKHHEHEGVRVDIENLDFLKVAHHGSDDSNCYEFLSKTRPKNAVISVGGQNFYGHPSSEVLQRLYDINPSVNLLRTDVSGNISVTVQSEGVYIMRTQANFE